MTDYDLRPENYGVPDLQMSEIFGEIVASPFDQHCMVTIIGKTGMGKSNASLDIAYKTSVYLAEHLGGVPEDYFTMDNVAIISMDSIIDVMANMKKQNVYILDDIGTGWNSRDFAKKSNKIMNNIVQTFRKWRTLLILTVPDTALIDTVPRNLMHYQIEMTQQCFEMGLSIGKLSRVVRLYRKQKNIYPFVQKNGVKYVNCMFERAPEHIINDYEAKRTLVQESEQAKYLEELKLIHQEMEEKAKPKKETMDDSKSRYSELDVSIRMLKEVHPTWSYSKIAGQVGCSKSKVGTVLKKYNMDLLSASSSSIL